VRWLRRIAGRPGDVERINQRLSGGWRVDVYDIQVPTAKQLRTLIPEGIRSNIAVAYSASDAHRRYPETLDAIIRRFLPPRPINPFARSRFGDINSPRYQTGSRILSQALCALKGYGYAKSPLLAPSDGWRYSWNCHFDHVRDRRRVDL
jgi:hypothetical protein